jgi:hypothetical protein
LLRVQYCVKQKQQAVKHHIVSGKQYDPNAPKSASDCSGALEWLTAAGRDRKQQRGYDSRVRVQRHGSEESLFTHKAHAQRGNNQQLVRGKALAL